MSSRIGSVLLLPVSIISISTLALISPTAGSLFQELLFPCLVFILFCMGLHTGWEEFRQVIQHPTALWIGVGLQFVIMPALAFGLSKLFALPPELTIGMVLVGAAPGGLASNMLTLLVNGRVALSVSMTLCSSLAAILLTPWLTVFYLHSQITISPWPLMQSLVQLILLPVIAGVVLHRFCPKLIRLVDPVLPAFASLGIAIAIAALIALNRDNLHQLSLVLIAAALLHNILGLGLGWLASRLCGHDHSTAITIAIEVGTQNTGLAMALAVKHFSALAALPSIIFSFSQNLLGILPAIISPERGNRTKSVTKIAQDA
ncbi:bile acid:sodium symporter family protein [Spongorhabdus nitratireducens]